MRAADVRIGAVFGCWTVTGPFERLASGAALFPCRCLCGTERVVLFRGGLQSLSCGCARIRVRHGGSKDRLNRVWRGMRERCSNPHRKEWPNYGGRGIRVCAEWDDYAVFRDWALANGYEEGLDIDRQDNDSNYEPGNCHFITRSQNLRNKRNSRMLGVFGEIKSMADWAEDERCAVSYATLESRLRLGWAVQDALITPKGRWNPARSA